jgi:hypothetical protein
MQPSSLRYGARTAGNPGGKPGVQAASFPECRLAARTPVCDHAGVVLYWADRTRTAELLRDPRVDVLRSRTRIKALQYRGPDPAALTSGSHHRRPAGTPHRNETYYNVKGVWHLDKLPESYREYFCLTSDDIKLA